MSGTSRRKLLKSIAAGSGAIVAGKSLPESWSRPVVDSVLLPAHAQTSGGPFSGAASESTVSINPDSNLFASLMERMVEPAHARPNYVYNAYVCIADHGNDTATVDAVVSRSDGFCTFSNHYLATNVPIGSTSFTDMNMTAGGCKDAASILPFINNAFAIPIPTTFGCQVTVTSTNGTATGQVKVNEAFDEITATLNYSVGAGACFLPGLVCCPED